MTRKLITIIALLSTLAIFMFTGCGQKDEEPNVPTAEEMIASQYNDLISAFPEDVKKKDITDYITRWAQKKKISCYEEDGILILSKPASKKYEKKGSISLLTEITGKNNEYEMQSMACLLYTLEKIEKHPAIYAAIVPEGKAESLPAEIKSSSAVINMQSSEEPEFYTSGASTMDITLSSDVKYQKTRYNSAYRINIKDLEGGLINNIEESHPNPILSINSFLTGLKNSGIVYDIGSYNTSPSFNKYLKGASALVVVSSADEEKFLKKLDSYIENFEDKWKDTNESLSITYKKTSLPSKVLDTLSEENLTSVLYTELSGLYEDNETDEINGYVNIAGVKIKDGKASIKVKVYGRNISYLKKINNQVRTLADMSDYKYHRECSAKGWTSDLYNEFEAIAKASEITLPEENSIIRTLPCSYVDYSKHIAAMGINFDNWEEASTLIIEYAR